MTETDETIFLPEPAAAPARSGDARQVIVTTDLELDYAGASYFPSTATNFAQALPEYIDDLTLREGADVYDRMATDAQVYGDTGALRRAILANGHRLSIPEGEEENPLAQEILAFCISALSEMETSLGSVLDDFLWGIGLGSRIGHLVWRQDARWLLPYYIKTIPRKDYAYAVDNRGRLAGIEIKLAGDASSMLLRGAVPGSTKNLLPADRFMVFTWSQQGLDPRGMSQWRSAYNAWWRKRQAEIELSKFLVQLAGGAVVIELPKEATTSPLRNPDGSVAMGPNGQPILQDPADAALKAAERYRNGAMLALKGGASAKILTAEQGGTTFFQTLQKCNAEISHGILHTALVTNESQHQTRAATGTQKDVFDLLVDKGEQDLALVVYRQFLRPLVRYNYPGSEHLTPHFNLSAVEEADFGPLATAFGGIGYTLAPEHMPEVDLRLGLTPRTVTEDPATGEGDPPANFSWLKRKKKVG
jgi:hypothetical protein